MRSAMLGCSGMRLFSDVPGFEGPGFEDRDVRCSMLVLPWSMQRSRIVRVRQPEEIDQKRSDRDDDAVPIVAEAALRGWIN